MDLRDLPPKKAYDSDRDDVLADFFIPALSCSIKYSRLAGFFSSSTLAVAARGISRFISNNGKMELICGAKLSKADIEAMKTGYTDQSAALGTLAVQEISDIEDEFTRDHVAALAWMIAHGNLSIKIALVLTDDGAPIDADQASAEGIFHQKVGIMRDASGNIITFSGSDNESGSAWVRHIEEFKVFRSWEIAEQDYLQADLEKFARFWENRATRTRVFDLPEALRKELLRQAPADLSEVDLEKWKSRWGPRARKEVRLWPHQEQAVTNWLQNEKTGIFEMATGTGKTFAALGCVKRVLLDIEGVLPVISCPQTHLVRQWMDNIDEFRIAAKVIEADSSNPKWKDTLADDLTEISNGIKKQLIIVTTHDTLCSETFLRLMSGCQLRVLLVADEVHWLGAPELRSGLNKGYEMRLGLSATPRRYFDEEGTSEIFDFFGRTVYSLPLAKAINEINPATGETYLVPYEYKPRFIELSNDEMARYEKMTERIARSYSSARSEAERKEIFTALCIKRQEIVKNAEAKYQGLEEILDLLGRRITHCLVYVTPDQLERTQDILNSRSILQRRFTFREGITERESILSGFANGDYQVLVAMNCLDEGVDVPPARTAIIMASTGNPKQYIQRRGRILRRSKGKDRATIFDFVALPKFSSGMDSDFVNVEKKILIREMKRFKDFAASAINGATCLSELLEVQRRYGLAM
jgi:superfamily II DNA or RNA helicase